jgi:hypothetical protein
VASSKSDRKCNPLAFQTGASYEYCYGPIGTCAGESNASWARRLKIPLETITAKMITKGRVPEANVPGKDRHGGPACATVKDFGGWTPAEP